MDAAELIADRTALPEPFVGTLLTAVFTSLPELVTTIAAIRYGALTLAVGNVLGTNCLNVVVIGVADVVYREGSCRLSCSRGACARSRVAGFLYGCR